MGYIMWQLVYPNILYNLCMHTFNTWGRNKMAAIFSDDIFKYIFLNEVCAWGSNQKYPSIGSDNGLAPVRRQAIIWINEDLLHWRIYGK